MRTVYTPSRKVSAVGIRHKNKYGHWEILDSLPVRGCGCRKCNNARSQQNKSSNGQQSGGTMNSSVFKSRPQRSDPTVDNHYFNGPGDGSAHGHVQEERSPDGSVSYPYVRDVEGDEYDTD